MSIDVSKAKFVRRTGVVVPFTTKPVGNLPPLTGTVRPCSAAERGRFFDDEFPALKKSHGTEGAEAHLFARHITAWDYFADDEAADPLPITPESVASLPPAVFAQLEGVVTGTALGNGSAGG